jgi:hypothetical protein
VRAWEGHYNQERFSIALKGLTSAEKLATFLPLPVSSLDPITLHKPGATSWQGTTQRARGVATRDEGGYRVLQRLPAGFKSTGTPRSPTRRHRRCPWPDSGRGGMPPTRAAPESQDRAACD